MSWTDERVDLLRKLWTDGLSASQIAAELGGVTRNAVIGKVHRLGLSGRAKGNNEANPGRRKAAPAKSTVFSKAQKAPNGSQPRAASQPAPARPSAVVDVPKPVALMLNLLQLTESTCKFPIGDPQEENFGFCGASPRDNDPYCEYHCRLAYQPAADRRRDRNGGKTPAQIMSSAAQASSV